MVGGEPTATNTADLCLLSFLFMLGSWVLVGELPRSLLYGCITATLPTGELLILGGRKTFSSGNLNTVYKCSISLQC